MLSKERFDKARKVVREEEQKREAKKQILVDVMKKDVLQSTSSGNPNWFGSGTWKKGEELRENAQVNETEKNSRNRQAQYRAEVEKAKNFMMPEVGPKPGDNMSDSSYLERMYRIQNDVSKKREDALKELEDEIQKLNPYFNNKKTGKLKLGTGKNNKIKKLQDEIYQYNDILGLPQKVTFGEWLGKNAKAGLDNASSGFYKTLDFLDDYVPLTLGGGIPGLILYNKFRNNVADPIHDLNVHMSGVAEQSGQEARAASESRGKGYKYAGALVQGTIDALPDAAFALVTGGASEAGTALSAGAEVIGAVGKAGKIGKAVDTTRAIGSAMVKNPQFWTSFLRTVGSDYEEARENGADEVTARLYAAATSLLNAGVEIGGGIEKLPGNLKNSKRSAKEIAWEWAKSSVEEGSEEVSQSIISQSMANLMYDKDKRFLSFTDEDAVINPDRLAEEFGMGAGVGAILGGGQIALQSAMEHHSNNRFYRDIYKDATGEMNDKTSYQRDLIDYTIEEHSGEALQYAKELKSKLDYGYTLSAKEIGKLIYLNENAIKNEIDLEEISEQRNGEKKTVTNTPKSRTNVQKTEEGAKRGVIGRDFNVKPDAKSNKTAISLITEKLGAEGRKNYSKAYEQELRNSYSGNEAEFLRSYSRYYLFGLDGKNIKDMPEAYANIISEKSANIAFKAGRADRNTSIDEKYSRVNEAVIYDGGLILNHNTEVMPAETNEVLEKLGKMFGVTVEVQDKVYGNINSDDDSNVKFSKKELENIVEKSYSEQVKETLHTNISDGNQVRIMNQTPSVLKQCGLNDLPMQITRGHLRDINHSKVTGIDKYHGISEEIINKLPELMADPAIVFDSISERNSEAVCILAKALDSDGLPIVVVIKPDGTGRYNNITVDNNMVLSVYGKKSPQYYINQIDKNIDKVILINKIRTRELLNAARLQLPAGLNNLKSNYIIHKSKNVVKSKFSKNSKTDIEVNGSYGNGEVKLSYDKMIKSGNVGEAAEFIINHEIAHRVQELAPKEYRRFREIALDVAITGDRAVYINSYAERVGLTYDEACDEIVADVVGNEKFAERFAEKDMGTAEKVKNWIKDILDRLGLWKYTESERLYRTWERAVEKAQKQIEKNRTSAGSVNKKGNIKYSINEKFYADFDRWIEDGKPDRKALTVGNTSEALKSIGVKEQTIKWDTSKINKMLKKHSYLDASILKQIPQMIEEPILIMQSKHSESRILLFGEVYDGDGLPIMTVLELLPSMGKKSEIILDEIKIASVHSRKNQSNPTDMTQTQNLINSSDILYVEPDKKRTEQWLMRTRLQLPFGITTLGSIKSITYPKASVNTEYKNFHTESERLYLDFKERKVIQNNHTTSKRSPASITESPFETMVSQNEPNVKKNFQNTEKNSSGMVSRLYKENIRLKKRNEILEERALYLKNQWYRSKPFSPNMADINKLARQYGKNYTGKKNISEELIKIYRKLNRATAYQQNKNYDMAKLKEFWNEAIESVEAFAGDIVRYTYVKKEVSTATYNRIRKHIRSTKISFPAQYINDFGSSKDFNDFRKRHFGRMTVTTQGDGIPIDVLWTELSEMYGEYFLKDVTHPADQLLYIGEFFDATAVTFENPFDADIEEATQSVTFEVFDDLFNAVAPGPKTQADKWNDTYLKMLEEEREKRKRAVERIEKSRQNALDEVAKLKKERVRQRKRIRAEAYNDSVRKDLIRTMARAKRLYETKGARTNFEMEQEKLDILNSIDLESLHMSKSTFNNLQELKNYYETELRSHPNFVPDKHIEGMLDRLSKKQVKMLLDSERKKYFEYMDILDKGGTIPKDERGDFEILKEKASQEMDMHDVVELLTYFRYVEHEIRTRDIEIGTADRRDIYTKGAEIIRDINNTKGTGDFKISDTFNRARNGFASPKQVLRRITGYVDSDPLANKVKAFQQSEIKAADYEMKAYKPFTKWADDVKYMEEISGEKAKLYEFKVQEYDELGREKGTVKIELTKGMIISLWLHNKNNSNKRSMAYGGVSVPNGKLYHNGSFDKAYSRGTTVKISPKEAQNITNVLDEKDLRLASDIYDYFNTFSKRELNAVSTVLYGYEKATVKDYYPIITDKRYLASESDGLVFDGLLEHASYMHERSGNASAILLEDAISVLDRSIRQHAKFVGYAIEIRNFKKLYNYTVHGTEIVAKKDSYGRNLNMSGNPITDPKKEEPLFTRKVIDKNLESVKQTIEAKWGRETTEYIDNMLADMQNGRKDRSGGVDFIRKIHGNYVKSVLTYNIPVAVNQFASYVVAAPKVGWGSLVKGMKFGKVDLELMEKYTPLQWQRNRGEFDPSLADALSDEKVTRFSKYTNFMAMTDALVTRKLWKAAEYNIQKKFSDLKVGSDEYYKKVGELYNSIILDTQPNSGVMERPGYLRADSMTKMILSFTGEPLKNVGMMVEASENFVAKKKQYAQAKETGSETTAKKAYNEASKELIDTFASQALASLIYSTVVGIAKIAVGSNSAKKHYEDEEEGKITFSSYNKAMAADAVESFFTQIPFTSEIWDVVNSLVTGEKYYGNDFIPTSALTDLVEGGLSLASNSMRFLNGEMTWQEMAFAANDALTSFSYTAGVPMKNVENIAVSLAEHIMNFTIKNEYIKKYETSKLRNAVTSKDAKPGSDVYQILYRAFKNGDKEGYDHIVYDLLNRGVQISDIEARMKSLSKNDDNFDYSKALSMYAGIQNSESVGGYEKYLEKSERLGIDEGDLEKGINIIESGLSYKEIVKNINDLYKEKYFNSEQKEFFNSLVRKKYNVNALSYSQYKKYTKVREETYQNIIGDMDFGASGYDNNKLYDKAAKYAEDIALATASDGEYIISDAWIEKAKDAKDTLGISSGEFIQKYIKYGQALYSEKTVETAKKGYNIDHYLEFYKNCYGVSADIDPNTGKSIPNSKQNKIIAIIDEMNVTNEEKAYFFSTQYTSQKNNPWINYLR